MAHVDLNAVTQHFRGRVGDIVFRRVRGRLITSLRPRPTEKPSSEGQLGHRSRFKQAAAFGKSAQQDEALRAVYAPVAQARGMAIYTVALGDFFNPPTIDGINTSGYHRQAGGTIGIRARDDIAVQSVTVGLRDATSGSLIESGAAQPVEGDNWNYTARSAIDATVRLQVEVTARDHARNATVHTLELAPASPTS